MPKNGFINRTRTYTIFFSFLEFMLAFVLHLDSLWLQLHLSTALVCLILIRLGEGKSEAVLSYVIKYHTDGPGAAHRQF